MAAQDIDETPRANETPEQMVCRLSREKAMVCLQQAGDDELVVLGSDTVVVHGSQIMGQPENKQQALQMLQTLSGSRHLVLTAVTVANLSHSETVLSTTGVKFRPISPIEAQTYWETGEPRGKAGSYAIQGYGAVFVEFIEGSYSGVMGLPLFETAQLLQQFGLPCWQAMDSLNGQTR